MQIGLLLSLLIEKMGDYKISYKDTIPCCHCVNIENSDIEKYFKARCITDFCVKEVYFLILFDIWAVVWSNHPHNYLLF